MTEVFISHSESETRHFARQLAASLKSGDMLSLSGELGAGKTVFMKGIAEFYNCLEQLSSPTFSLFNIYQGSLQGEPVMLHHFDLYRIESQSELDAIGFDEYLAGCFLSVVEWGDRFMDYAPLYTLTVSLEYAGNESRRIVVKRSIA